MQMVTRLLGLGERGSILMLCISNRFKSFGEALSIFRNVRYFKMRER